VQRCGRVLRYAATARRVHFEHWFFKFRTEIYAPAGVFTRCTVTEPILQS